MGRKLARRWKTEVQIWSVLKALDGAAGLENSHCLQEWHNRWLDVQRRWPGGAIWAWQRPLQVNTRDCCLNNTAKKLVFVKGGSCWWIEFATCSAHLSVRQLYFKFINHHHICTAAVQKEHLSAYSTRFLGHRILKLFCIAPLLNVFFCYSK